MKVRREKSIGCKLSDDEYELLKELAEEEQRTSSSLVRLIVIAYLKDRGGK